MEIRSFGCYQNDCSGAVLRNNSMPNIHQNNEMMTPHIVGGKHRSLTWQTLLPDSEKMLIFGLQPNDSPIAITTDRPDDITCNEYSIQRIFKGQFICLSIWKNASLWHPTFKYHISAWRPFPWSKWELPRIGILTFQIIMTQSEIFFRILSNSLPDSSDSLKEGA